PRDGAGFQGSVVAIRIDPAHFRDRRIRLWNPTGGKSTGTVNVPEIFAWNGRGGGLSRSRIPLQDRLRPERDGSFLREAASEGKSKAGIRLEIVFDTSSDWRPHPQSGRDHIDSSSACGALCRNNLRIRCSEIASCRFGKPSPSRR